MRLAFIGFRHGHVLGLYRAAASHPGMKIVGACEEDPEAAAPLLKSGGVALTHRDYAKMLDEAECDAVGVGDYYGIRGQRIIEALRHGKHVISDKPICTRMEELEEIAALVARNRLCVGCLLDLRGLGPYRTARRLIRDGAIGEVHTVNFTAQHPLLLGQRPAWYFEPDKHGGTINDIGIHAFDVIPWITCRKIAGIVAARAWNARVPQHPAFQDAAQFMLRMDNGGGVLGDVSYLAPEACGYAVPQYWRMVFHGSGGAIEVQSGKDAKVMLARSEDTAPQWIAPIRRFKTPRWRRSWRKWRESRPS